MTPFLSPLPRQSGRGGGAIHPDGPGHGAGTRPPPGAFLGPSGWPTVRPGGISGATNGVLHGDFGYSIDSGEAVMTRIARGALPTFILATFALVIWLSIAFVQQSWIIDEGSSNPGGIGALYLMKAMIPVGFALLFLQSLAQAIQAGTAWKEMGPTNV